MKVVPYQIALFGLAYASHDIVIAIRWPEPFFTARAIVWGIVAFALVCLAITSGKKGDNDEAS